MTKINLQQDISSALKQGATAQACATPARLATFTILAGLLLTSAGYGLLLPVLSALLVKLHPTDGENTSLHVGLVTAVYAAGAFLSAPAWGRLADRSHHTQFIAISLLAGGVTLLMTTTASNLMALYLWRFLAGAAAGAVSPAVQSWFSAWSEDAEWRSNYTIWSTIASNSGFLIGPLLGGLLATAPPTIFGNVLAVTEIPLALNGTLLIMAALATAWIAPAPMLATACSARKAPRPQFREIAPLLTNVLVTAIAVGAFEVGLSIRAADQGSMPVETGLLLAECTIFMSAAQALLLLHCSDWAAASCLPWSPAELQTDLRDTLGLQQECRPLLRMAASF
jgi:MFS family permease